MVKKSKEEDLACDLESFQVVDGSVNVFFESPKTMVDDFDSSQCPQKSMKKTCLKIKNLPKKIQKRLQEVEQDEEIGVKDLGERVCQRIKGLFQKGDFSQQFKKIIKEYQEINMKKISGIKGMEMLFRHPKLRTKIGEYILSGQLKREIISSRKRCSISEKVKTNSVRNQVIYYNFIVFSFLQGGTDNFSSLRQPILVQNCIQKSQNQQKKQFLSMDTQGSDEKIFDVLEMQEEEQKELSFDPVFEFEFQCGNVNL